MADRQQIGAQFLDREYVAQADPQNYREYFNAPKDHPYRNSGYFDCGPVSLVWIRTPGGFSFRYETDDVSHFSVGDRGRMNEIVEAGNEQPIPAGSIVPVEQAWPVVEAFFADPSVLPATIEWVEEDEVDWAGAAEKYW